MIEVVLMRLFDNPPGIKGYLIEVRMIDKSKGTHMTDFGPMLNWDKGMAMTGKRLTPLLVRFGNKITEILSK